MTIDPDFGGGGCWDRADSARVRKAPWADPKQIARARHELANGLGIARVARMTGMGTGTVHKPKREMAVLSRS